MRSIKLVGSVLFASGVMLGLAACSGGSSSTGTTGGGGGTNLGATNIYVIQNPTTFGNGSGTILQLSVITSGPLTPIATITGPANTSFNAVASDGAGNLYVSYYGPKNAGGVAEYAAGSTGATFLRSLPASATTGVTAVDGLATSSAGEIFVAEDYGGVQAFSATATGDIAPSRRILGAYETGGGLSTIGTAYAIAADSSDNLYVVNEGLSNGLPLLVFGPTATGNVAPLRSIGGALTGLTSGSLIGITTDAAGNLYATVEAVSGPPTAPVFTGSILEFAAGASGNVAPIRTISGPLTLLHAVAGIKVDSVGNIFVVSATPTATTISPTVLEFAATASGNVAPTSTFTSTAWTYPDNSGSLAIK